MRILKYLHDPKCDEERTNLEAVLDAYRRCTLKVDSGVTIWFAGHMIRGPHNSFRPDLNVFHEAPELRAKYGPGRIWIEDVRHHDIYSICMENSDIFSR
jgi:hypothetical protein